MASTKSEVDSTWATPHTFVGGELVTSTTMNGMRDNLNALKTPAYGVAVIDEASDYSTNSTSYVDVDGVGDTLTLTITTGSGNVLVGFTGSMQCSSTTYNFHMNIGVDGSDQAPDDGIVGLLGNTSQKYQVSFVYLIEGLSAGEHVFKLRWKSSSASGTITLYSGAGTSGSDLHPQFWAMEV